MKHSIGDIVLYDGSKDDDSCGCSVVALLKVVGVETFEFHKLISKKLCNNGDLCEVCYRDFSRFALPYDSTMPYTHNKRNILIEKLRS